MFLRSLAFTAFFGLLGNVFCSGDEPRSAQPSLETIKQLAGEWVELDEAGKPTETVVARYKVTAAGSAVLEILFPGTEHEMVSVYHQQGKDLVMTHYCMLGNQPFMKATFGKSKNQLVFECQNIDKQGENHMHEGVVTFVDSDHLRSEWRAFEQGKNTHVASFQLKRKK